jgi:exonuclease SbcC
MKILAIRIKNLASLEGTYEIDFTREPLYSAGIFAITGPTGAGKSTLLDAICLALFSKTPRHIIAKEMGVEIQDVVNNKISQGDVRNILRKGTAEGYSEVDFQGMDGNNYRAVWSVRRARNKVDGSLQNDTIELINLTSTKRFPEKKMETLKEIERLIGLNFDQFTRSVLLAQGDFTAFLKADKDEKSSLLEKLTGTDIYSEISKKIYENYKLAEQDLKDLQRNIEGINSLSEFELHEIQISKQELVDKILLLENESKILINEIEWNNNLDKIQKDKELAEINLKTSLENKVNSEERFLKLSTIENIQETRILYETKLNAEIFLGDNKKELEKLNLLIEKIEILSEGLKKNDIESELLLKTAIDNQKNAQSDIENAKNLDIIISEKQKNLEVEENEYNIALEIKNQKELNLKNKEEELANLTKLFSDLENWRNENDNRWAIAENINLIISKLADLKKYFSQKEKLILEKELKQKQKIDLELIVKNAENELKDKNEFEKKLKLAFQDNQRKTESIGIDFYKNKIEELNRAIELNSCAKGIWDLMYSTLQDCNLLKQKINTNEAELVSQQKILEVEKNNLMIARIKKEQSQKMLTKAELETTENVEIMRSQLVDEEPCPVCGSCIHPYQNNSTQFHQVLLQLMNENKECNNQYDSCLEKASRLGNFCEKLHSDLILLNKDLNEKTIKHTDYQHKWNNFEFEEDLQNMPDEDKSLWFEDKIDLIKKDISDIQLIIKNYESVKIQLDIIKNEIEKAERELIGLDNQINTAKNEINKNLEEFQNIDTRIKQIEFELESIKILLDNYFTNSNWLNEWHKDSSEFENKLKKWTEDWFSNIKQIENCKTNINICESEVNLNKVQVFEIATNVIKKKEKLDEDLKVLSTFQLNRNRLFEGKSIKIVEQEFISEIEKAQILKKQFQEKLNEITNELILNYAKKNQLHKDIESLKDQINNQKIKIENWITIYNNQHNSELTHEIVYKLLSFTMEWIADERKVLNEIKDTITKNTALFDEREKKYNEHLCKRISEKNIEDTTDLYKDVKNKLNDLNKEKNDFDFQLKIDEKNKEQIGEILEKINSKAAVFENWSKLNELLGSADGKKFRQIAQEYTLDILLRFANSHLKILSNRYNLGRIPNSLALQVIDKDMGNEIRSVHSLSGGESFIVSLALALGLASLSTNRMKVESLFIDEGFGSLDPATLSVAMDALEQLHNQGRKVGVISHVQEMTERIATQIRVVKLTNGKSKLEVVGL